MTANFWDLYYYYTYVKGINVAEKAPYFYEAFTKRLPSNYYYRRRHLFKTGITWMAAVTSGSILPQAAESEGAKYLPKEQTKRCVGRSRTAVYGI